MNRNITDIISDVVAEAPGPWIVQVCDMLRSAPGTASRELILQQIPATNNADLVCRMRDAIHLAPGQLSWEALGWALDTACALRAQWKAAQDIELLWAGPSPANQIPARRIDQALYDLIATAQKDILLVIFAAARIERLAGELLKAIARGVHVRLIFEFEQSSEGQLSYDALKAFPASLKAAAEVYHWPVENRERNQAGRPGKMHAKFAIIDDTALVSSANLTDDAFNRNLEMGVMIRDEEFIQSAKAHIDSLIRGHILQPVK